ncbi:hypothetical protein [Liquorilactobacillus hordei]|uniref:Uncharacterized protein n=1 Tax=Liquorilactobacillus hordei DSM 19519 TaxID=1423759 RepID=A0A0R1MQM3_9LACO|nr:hypothetical protein [Liquorilactobacillus hordei]KRL08036.1 hypothetical protein FC92_GL001109 [Liquorilactobacillus hordei DSM 19519]QYH51020.1 hypothetical protein G6O70_00195 [Liquorilactobacillus hordei DSM 19519]
MKNRIEKIFSDMKNHKSSAIYYNVREDNFFLHIDPELSHMEDMYRSGNVKYVAMNNINKFDCTTKKELLIRMIILEKKLSKDNTEFIRQEIEELILGMYVVKNKKLITI